MNNLSVDELHTIYQLIRRATADQDMMIAEMYNDKHDGGYSLDAGYAPGDWDDIIDLENAKYEHLRALQKKVRALWINADLFHKLGAVING